MEIQISTKRWFYFFFYPMIQINAKVISRYQASGQEAIGTHRGETFASNKQT